MVVDAIRGPLHMVVHAYIEFSYKPDDITRLFTDVGKANEVVADILRLRGASHSGTGLGAVALGPKPQRPPFFFAASAREVGANPLQ